MWWSSLSKKPARPECSLSSAYPELIQQWCGSIERYAGENGLDPDLIASVMLQESGEKRMHIQKAGRSG